MSALNKEKIYEELRNYHANAFPDKFPTEKLDNLRAEFGVIEDEVISMLLGLVNGKRVIVELGDSVTNFQKKLNESEQEVFASKSAQLLDLMAMAKGFDFQLRKVRVKAVKT